MGDMKMRKKFWHINRYQRPIIIAIIVPVLVFSIGFTIFILKFHIEINNLIVYGSRSDTLHIIHEWRNYIIIGTWVIFLLIFQMAYGISHKLVGGFSRFIRELDEIIDGQGHKTVHIRDKDALAKDLMHRVNILIKNLPKPVSKLRD